MKKLLFTLIALATLLTACDGIKQQRHEKVESTLGYTYTVDTINGHIYIWDNHGMQEYPECPQCKENLKTTITEVVDSIIDSKVVELLGMEK